MLLTKRWMRQDKHSHEPARCLFPCHAWVWGAPHGPARPVPDPNPNPGLCARALELLELQAELQRHSEHAPLLHPPSLIRVIAMEICYSNAEKLEMPSGEDDLKGPQWDEWSLLCLLCSQGPCPSPWQTHQRVLGNFCVSCCISYAEIHSSHPLLQL